MEQINDCGIRAAAKYEGITYWTYNWRKMGGSALMLDISKREKFYMQDYCGCAYSFRDTNNYRVQNSRERIQISKKFYSYYNDSDE